MLPSGAPLDAQERPSGALRLLMRVRYNAALPDEHYLDCCLDRLPRLDAMDAVQLWQEQPPCLERTLPRFALAQPQDGWGLAPPRYEFHLTEQRLRFAPQALEHLAQPGAPPRPSASSRPWTSAWGPPASPRSSPTSCSTPT